MYLEEMIGEPRPGVTHVYGKLSADDRSWYVVPLTTGGASPFLSVTREQYLKMLIWELGGRGAKAPYQKWLDEVPVRKRVREETAALLPTNERAVILKQQKKNEREMTAQFKAGTEGPQPVDPVRAKLASLAPAQRKSPVWVAESWGYGPFLAPNAANAFSMPCDEIPRSIARCVHPPGHEGSRCVSRRSCTGGKPPVQRALNYVAKALDWSALAALLDPMAR